MKKNKKIKIFVDSSAKIPPNIIKKYDIEVIYLNIMIDGKEYLDNDKEISFDDIYKAQSSYKTSTSQGNIFSIEKKIDHYLKDYDFIYMFPLCKNMSGLYNSLYNLSLKEKYKKNVIVFDIKTGWLGMQEIFSKIMPMIHKNPNIEIREIENIANEVIKRSTYYLMPTDFKYLKISGRFGVATEIIGKVLKIKLLFRFEKKWKKIAKSRSFSHIIELMSIDFKRRYLKNENIDNVEFTLSHSSKNKESIEMVLNLIKSQFNVSNIKLIELAPIFMCHTGREAFCLYLNIKK